MADDGFSNVHLERFAKRPRTEPATQLRAMPTALPSAAGAPDASVPDTSQWPHAQASVPGAPTGMPYDRLWGCQGARLTAAPPAIVQPGQIHGAYSQHLCSTQGVDKLKSHPPAAAGPTPGSWSSSCCSICREELTEGGEHAAACLKCGHTFGEACIRQWMSSCRKACPLCQAKCRMPDIRRLYNLPRLLVQQPTAAGAGAAGAGASGSADGALHRPAAPPEGARPYAPGGPDTSGWAAVAPCPAGNAQHGATSSFAAQPPPPPQQQQLGVDLLYDDMPTGAAALQERVFELSLELAKARAVLLGYDSVRYA